MFACMGQWLRGRLTLLFPEVFKQLPFVWNHNLGPCRVLRDNELNFSPNYCASTKPTWMD